MTRVLIAGLGSLSLNEETTLLEGNSEPARVLSAN